MQRALVSTGGRHSVAVLAAIGGEMAVFKKAGPGHFVMGRSSSLTETLGRVLGSILPPLKQASSSPSGENSCLDKGCKVDGMLDFAGPARIDGEIEGEINSNDTVVIGEEAVVSANIKAAAIVVAGAISGELSASRRIEICPSAKVLMGSLTAPEVLVGEGAVVEGTPITRVVSEDRKPKTTHLKGLVAEPKSKERTRQL